MIKTWMKTDLMKNPNSLVPAYLTASYLYYNYPEEDPIMSDELYDWVCKELMTNWDKTEHRHKEIIDRDDLSAGTCYSLREHDYPIIVKSLAFSMSRGRFTAISNEK